MIVYDLKCRCGSQFEGWFENRADFEKQSSDRLIACPLCGSDKIHKILSPVAIHAGGPHPEEAAPHSEEEPAPQPEDAETSPETVMKFFRAIQRYVEKNFEDVGSRLAEESLKIHYGVVESRNIRGVATEQEERMLTGEGIDLLKIPMLKKSSDPKLN
ncbi:MAG: DUF1178 family protein [Desulfobulbaceae bacterium]|nr:DUF1178 family protein [Desulfobulbaceae bacterium]